MWYNKKKKGSETVDKPQRERVILHCDMNNCYASIEMKLNPALRGKAIAVGGSEKDRHGIILAKSEQAKRYGVKTAETIWQAKQKCPHLVVIPPHFEEYHKYSLAARAIYAQYTDLIEPFGLDECWLDVTESGMLFGTGEQIAHTIKERIKEELGITVSVGVSFNKVFAKLGSDLKKPDAVTVIPSGSFREMLSPLPVQELLGVGKSTLEKLHRMSIYTIGQLSNTPVEQLVRKLGKQGEMLFAYANGLDSSPVTHEAYIAPPKSIGRGMTCPKDLTTREEIWKVLYRLSDTVADELRREKLRACGLQVTVRDTFFVDRQSQRSYRIPLYSAREITGQAMELVEKLYGYQYPIRALTVRAISLVDEAAAMQLTMGEDALRKDKSERREKVIYELRGKYGKAILKPATLTRAPTEEEQQNEMENAPGFKSAILQGWKA